MAAFPSGTRKFFKNSTAPSGWTKDANTFDHALRIVTTSSFGSGGTVAFSSVFSSSKAISDIVQPGSPFPITISPATMDIPAHTHTYVGSSGTVTNSPNSGYPYSAGPTAQATITTWYGNPSPRTSGSAGTSGGHTHTMSTSLQVTFGSSPTNNMGVNYVDAIICIKN